MRSAATSTLVACSVNSFASSDEASFVSLVNSEVLSLSTEVAEAFSFSLSKKGELGWEASGSHVSISEAPVCSAA